MRSFSVSYSETGIPFLADQICPVVPGDVSRKYAKFSRADANAIVNQEMSAKAKPVETSLDVSNDTYTEVPYGLRQTIANSEIADASDLPELFEEHMKTLMHQVNLAREKRVLDLVLTSGNFAAANYTALSSTNRWDVTPSTSTANPVNDIRITAGCAAGLATQFNAMVIGQTAFEYLRTHPKVIAACGASSLDRVVSEEQIKALFDLEYLYVSKQKYNAAGNSTASYSFLAGKGCALLRIQPGARRRELSFCKTFRHHPMQFVMTNDDSRGVTGVTEIKLAYADAEEVVANDAGYLLGTVIS